MNFKSYKEAVLSYYEELWNEKNKSYIDLLFDDEITFRGSLNVETKGKKEFEKYMDNVNQGLPNLYHGVEMMVCENNLISAKVHYHGTHTGKLFKLEATNKTIRYSGASFFQFRNKKIVNIWVLGDLINLYKQLDVKDII
ncbi:ester cyclase [Sulfurospirillum arcachonense]|uniref:ester cyclase n=1 Tax=Sulfurospirillum arcachonense TaxID=57666 RepID=UPI000467FEC7|nr:ester cyclase [Sulfurospirillum arcachonense]